jgi:uroporphyrin-III C-methyltransferase
MLVDYARSHGHVVRLKGGDPFVFGRGHEEVDFIRSNGIRTEVIPGISSAISVPALQGIPITHRGISESFWVITGTTSSGKVSQDIYTAAKTKATVVVLMGVNKLDEIVSIYQNECLGDFPVAIIQNGAMENEKIAIGQIDSIQQIAKEKQIGTPAVIVIGEVVSLHEVYHSVKESYELVSIK